MNERQEEREEKREEEGGREIRGRFFSSYSHIVCPLPYFLPSPPLIICPLLLHMENFPPERQSPLFSLSFHLNISLLSLFPLRCSLFAFSLSLFSLSLSLLFLSFSLLSLSPSNINNSNRREEKESREGNCSISRFLSFSLSLFLSPSSSPSRHPLLSFSSIAGIEMTWSVCPND